MSEYILDVSVYDGKYRVVMGKKGGLKALRYDEEWRDCVGDNLIYWLAAELREAREEIERLKRGEEKF